MSAGWTFVSCGLVTGGLSIRIAIIAAMAAKSPTPTTATEAIRTVVSGNSASVVEVAGVVCDKAWVWKTVKMMYTSAHALASLKIVKVFYKIPELDTGID